MQVLINSGAGSVLSSETQTQAAQLSQMLEAAGLEFELQFVPGAELADALWRAAQAKPDAVVVGGGDGSLSTAAGILSQTGVALGVLPLGTLNHFAKDLGIPLELEAAVQNLAQGQSRYIDLGEVNGQIFINNASLGLYPASVKMRERIQREAGWSKWPAMLVAAGRALKHFRQHKVIIHTDNRSDVLKTPMVFIGNNEYALSLPETGSRACLDGGCLGLVVLRVKGRVSLLKAAWKLATGQFREAPEIDAMRLTEFEIHSSSRRLRVARDGEVGIMLPPLRFRSLPKALLVITPLPPLDKVAATA